MPVAHKLTKLKEWRTFRGLSQDELAERSGLTHGSISRLETGEAGYVQNTLERIARALETDPGSVIMRDPRVVEGLLSIWDRVPLGERRRALRVLRAFASATNIAEDKQEVLSKAASPKRRRRKAKAKA